MSSHEANFIIPPCPCPSIPFLDTSASVVNNQIVTDLYRKPTDRCQYLLTSSCHPAHVTENIPFSLAYRIIRICSEPESRDKRLSELKELLMSRSYKSSLVDNAIERARKIPRMEALKKLSKTLANPPDLFLPSHMTQDFPVFHRSSKDTGELW